MNSPDESPHGDHAPVAVDEPKVQNPANLEAPRPPARADFAAGLFPGLTVQDLTLTEAEMLDTFEGYL